MALRVVANFLDVLGIATIGAIVAIALETPVDIPFSKVLAIEGDQLVLALSLFAAGLFISKTGISIFLSRISLLYLAKVETHFSMKIAGSIFSGSLSSLKNQSRSEIDWAILRSTGLAFTGILGQLMSLIAEGSLAILIIGFLLINDWLSAVILTLYFSAFVLAFHFFSQRVLAKAGAEYSEGSIAVSGAVSDMTAAYREITVLSKTTTFLAKLASARKRAAHGAAINLHLGVLPRQFIEVALVLGAVSFLSLQMGTGGAIADMEIFAVLIVGSLRLISALLPLQRGALAILYASSSAKSAQSYLWEIKNEFVQRAESAPAEKLELDRGPSQTGLAVEFEKVSFAYSQNGVETMVLDEIDLQIQPGSFVAIIGPSGAGKSTLVDLLLGINLPSSGRVAIDGFSPQELRLLSPGAVSYVPQKPGLIFGTVSENIALGEDRDCVDHQSLREAVGIAQLEDFIANLPEGLESSLGRQSDSLSGGQVQRIGLARALYSKPKLLVLDEATSALDAETESQISQKLMALKGSVTLVTVAHRLSSVREADVIHVVDQGKIVASGTFSQLRETNPLVSKYVELMSLDDESSSAPDDHGAATTDRY